MLLTGACIALAALSLLTSGCASVIDIQNPTYSVRDIRPHVSIGIPLSASSIDFNFLLGVDNPNRISLPVAHLDFDLFANDTHLITAISRERVTIPARGYGEVPVRAISCLGSSHEGSVSPELDRSMPDEGRGDEPCVTFADPALVGCYRGQCKPVGIG